MSDKLNKKENNKVNISTENSIPVESFNDPTDYSENNDNINYDNIDIDNDTDINFHNLNAKDKSDISKKKKKNEIINKLNQRPDLDIEKWILFLLVTSKTEEILPIVSKYWIKTEFFLHPIWNKIFNLIMKLSSEWNIDYLLLKDRYEKDAKTEAEMKEFKTFFKFEWFAPQKELIREYSFLLADNFNKNKLNNLVVSLENAIKLKDDDSIKHLKYEIENFSLLNTEQENPDIWLISNDILAEDAREWINWAYKVKSTMVKTWFKAFDDKIWWYEKWTMTVYLARPSVWKSVALINWMYWAVQKWFNCLYVSAEMYAKYIFSRWASIDQEISNSKIRNPSKLNKKEHAKLEKFFDKFKNEELAHFYYDWVITAQDIEMKAKEIKASTGRPLDAIFVDYLWKVYPNNLDMSRSRNDIVWDISRELFSLGWALNIAMVTATQLNRWSAKNADQESLVPPTQSDIRDSWAVAQDADVLIWITRDFIAWSDCKTEEQYTDFNWHIIKNRNGEVWEITLNFHPVIQKLKDDIVNFENERTIEWLEKKNEWIQQEKIIKDILEENDTFSKNKEIF